MKQWGKPDNLLVGLLAAFAINLAVVWVLHGFGEMLANIVRWIGGGQ
jgi:hypothetical protein